MCCQSSDFCVGFVQFFLIARFHFQDGVFPLKETRHASQRLGFPLIQLRGMHPILARDLCHRFFFFEQFLHHLRFERRRILFAFHLVILSYLPSLFCPNSSVHYSDRGGRAPIGA